MRLIVIILSLFLDNYFNNKANIKSFGWVTKALALVQRFTAKQSAKLPGLPIALVLLLPTLVVAILQFFIDNAIFNLLLGFAVLWYCLGFHELINDKMEIENDKTKHSSFIHQLFWRSHEKVFALLFWFAILGPFAALLYRILVELRSKLSQEKDLTADILMKMHLVLAWLPARLSAIAFGLVGNLAPVFKPWIKSFSQFESKPLLGECGEKALTNLVDENVSMNPAMQALASIKRALVLWIAAIAVFTLGSLF